MQVKDILKKLIGHNNIILKARGNYAIRDSLKLLNPENIEKKILVQDQGGWLRYLDYPPKYGYIVEKIKTDDGVIKISELEELSRQADAIIYENPAGYFASQPLKQIYETCRKNGCKVILDITGSIGRIDNPGRYADVIICSFGEGKAVNLGHGGLISINDEFSFSSVMQEDFDYSYANALIEKLSELKERQKNLHEISKKIKNELKDFKVLKADYDGINVIVAFDSQDEKEKIIRYCDKNSFEYTLCPRYIRVMRDAVSIEVKRIS